MSCHACMAKVRIVGIAVYRRNSFSVIRTFSVFKVVEEESVFAYCAVLITISSEKYFLEKTTVFQLVG